MSIEILLALRELRMKTSLFPRGTHLFKVRIGGMQEHYPVAFTDRDEVCLKGPIKKDGVKGPDLEDLVNGTPSTLFYVPTSSEVMNMIRIKA